MGNNIKTSFDDFVNEGWLKKKKELTPDEEYQKQRRKQEKEFAEVTRKAKNAEKKFDPNDPYGEELDPAAEEIVAKRMKTDAEYAEKTGKYVYNSSNRPSSSSSRSNLGGGNMKKIRRRT